MRKRTWSVLLFVAAAASLLVFTGCSNGTAASVYAGTTGGLSISDDGGAGFTNRTTADGLGNNDVRGVYVVP